MNVYLSFHDGNLSDFEGYNRLYTRRNICLEFSSASVINTLGGRVVYQTAGAKDSRLLFTSPFLFLNLIGGQNSEQVR